MFDNCAHSFNADMEGQKQIVGAGVIALLGALYMLEMAPRYEDGIVELGKTQVVMVTKCSIVFSYVSNLSNYAMVNILL